MGWLPSRAGEGGGDWAPAAGTSGHSASRIHGLSQEGTPQAPSRRLIASPWCRSVRRRCVPAAEDEGLLLRKLEVHGIGLAARVHGHLSSARPRVGPPQRRRREAPRYVGIVVGIVSDLQTILS